MIILISISLATLAYFGISKSNYKDKNKKYSLYTVEKTPNLLFSGFSQAKNMEEFYYEPNLGEIEEILVHNGQAVKETDIIAVYKNNDMKEEEENLQDNLKLLSLSLENAKENLNNAKQKKEKIKTQINKYIDEKNKLTMNFSENSQEVLEVESSIQLSQSELEAQEEIVRVAEQLLKTESSSFSIEKEKIEKLRNKITTNVTTPIDGIAYINENGKKDISIPYVVILSSDTFIQGTVTEYDYEEIKLNQAVTIKTLNQSVETEGEIILINELPEINNGESNISSYSFFVDTEIDIHYGYNVQIALDLNQMVIPKEAMIKEEDNIFVYTYSKGRVKKTEINVEKFKGEYIIKKGLKQGVKIISDPDENLSDEKEVEIHDKVE